MKRKSRGHKVYEDERGRFWARPLVNYRRTWRKLKAVRLKEAIKECLSAEWLGKNGNFEMLADEYIKAGCPNRRLESRPKEFTGPEAQKIVMLKKYFGHMDPASIKIPLCLAYKAWRVSKIKKAATGERTVDMDLVTLSNVLSYGVSIGRLDLNFIRSGRPRFRHEKQIKHSRERAPQSGDELHHMAGYFFERWDREVFAWLTFFSSMTGCRMSELLRMRVDAKNEDQPGFISGNYLFLARSKSGVNPYALITPEMADMLKEFFKWHKDRYPESPWFFPGRQKGQRTGKDSFRHSMTDACTALGLPRYSPHGMRSFYVTKRRSDGASDPQIAAEIGDKTVDIIPRTYGDRPKVWTGGVKLSWLPSKGKPSWLKWKESRKSPSAKHSKNTMHNLKTNKRPVKQG